MAESSSSGPGSADAGDDPGDADGPTHLLDVDDLAPAAVESLLDAAEAHRRAHDVGDPLGELPGAQVAMLFEQPSTRTRVSFETGVNRLGGDAVFLGPGETQLARGEPVKDTARALSGYVDAVVARVADHATLGELAAYASVPVINALTDRAHPCQALADLLTLRDVAGPLSGTSVAWVGDGNNVARSFALACAAAGVDLTVATPPGHGLDDDVRGRAATLGAVPTATTDPAAAVAGADAVYTDVWVSMSDDDRATDPAEFAAFQVNADLLSRAPDAAVMHPLPAHRGEEITDAVIEGERSVVFRQAANRLHVQTALLATLCGDGPVGVDGGTTGDSS
jgi:ornithine carbamoyltransferase